MLSHSHKHSILSECKLISHSHVKCKQIFFFVLNKKAIAAELAATAGMSLIDWEAEWAESGTALAVGMIVAAVIAIVALLIVKRNAGKKAAVN